MVCFAMLRACDALRGSPAFHRAGGAGSDPGAGHFLYQWHADVADVGHSHEFDRLLRHGTIDRAVRLRQHYRAGKVPVARGGNRAVNEIDLPLWATIPATLLLIAGGLLALIGSIGLLRLRDFYARMHPPTMGTTLGTGCVLIASMIVSSALMGRAVIHELLITLFIVMTAPVTAMLLIRAAAYRRGHDETLP